MSANASDSVKSGAHLTVYSDELDIFCFPFHGYFNFTVTPFKRNNWQVINVESDTF